RIETSFHGLPMAAAMPNRSREILPKPAALRGRGGERRKKRHKRVCPFEEQSFAFRACYRRTRPGTWWTVVHGPPAAEARLLSATWFRCAACIHATSEQEHDEIRDFGLNNPVAIVPNGSGRHVRFLSCHSDASIRKRDWTVWCAPGRRWNRRISTGGCESSGRTNSATPVNSPPWRRS